MGNPIVSRLIALASGSIVGQLAMIGVLPIITRIYSPADFGLLGAFSAIVMIVLPAACLRFDLAIPIPSDDRDAHALAALGFAGATLVSVVVWVTLTLYGDAMKAEYVAVFDRFGWLVPLTLWTASVFSITQYFAIRRQRFRALAIAHATRGGLGAATQVGLGFAGIGPLGLVLGQAIYMGLGSISLVYSFLSRELMGLQHLDMRFLADTIRRYWRFPVFSMPESLLNSAASYLPMLMILWISGAEVAGLFYLAQRITSIPVGLIGGQLSRVFIGEAPMQLREGTLFRFTAKLMSVLFLATLVPSILGVLFAPHLADAALGDEWAPLADMLVLLIPAAFLQFCVSPVSTVLHVRSRQATSLVVQFGGLFFQIGAVLLCAQTGIAEPVTGFAIGSAIHYAIYAIVVLIAARD